MNIEKELQEAMADFETKYDAGIFPGWPKETGSALAHSGLLFYIELCMLSEICSSVILADNHVSKIIWTPAKNGVVPDITSIVQPI